MSLDELELVSLPLDLAAFDEIIDVRTPLEFAEDHLPGALNLPVLTNEERVEIGTLYKENSFEARRLGASCISTAIARHLREELATRDRRWSPLLYCWRGGLRSRSFAHVLRSVGWRARVLDGGYKAWRRFVMDDLEALFREHRFDFRILAGLTGTGKTRLLDALREAGAQVIDLEGLANHRGSLLGSRGPQPSQKRFETLLRTVLRALDPQRPVFAEAESNRIGSAYIPPPLWKNFSEGTVVELRLPLAERVRLLLEDYAHFPAQPADLSALLDQLRPLRGHKQVDAWQGQIAAGQWPEFVASILEQHYDLCYRRPGSPEAVYRSPVHVVQLPSADAASYRAAAADLVQWAGSAVTP